MNIKKLATMLFCTVFILSGCGNKAENTAADAPTPTPSEAVAPAESEKPAATPSPTAAPTATPEKTTAPVAPTPTTEPTAESAAPQQISLEDTLNKILSGVETPRYEILPIDSSNFSHYMFVDYVEGAKGVSADALISSTAHSVCLISLPSGTDAAGFAAKVKQNADPRKWICTEAEAVEVAVKDNLVLLVMSDNKTTSAIVDNFKK